QKIKTMLEGVVQRGTARNFRHGFYQIAGKSGTANKVVDGRYTNKTYASFAGYCPAEAPRYSCIVVVDDPQGYAWHFGGSMTAVVKDIADKIAAKDLNMQDYIMASDATPPPGTFPFIRAGHRKELLKLCDDLGVAYRREDLPAAWVRSSIDGEQIAWKDNGEPNPGRVPHVRGMTLKNALFLLENCGLTVTVQGNKGGRVSTQSLLPGTTTHGQAIIITMT
ncbi:MAG: penicillin-binding transpeptidase domain-containing protein, partial [Bacteroidota bacterium]